MGICLGECWSLPYYVNISSVYRIAIQCAIQYKISYKNVHVNTRVQLGIFKNLVGHGITENQSLVIHHRHLWCQDLRVPVEIQRLRVPVVWIILRVNIYIATTWQRLRCTEWNAQGTWTCLFDQDAENTREAHAMRISDSYQLQEDAIQRLIGHYCRRHHCSIRNVDVHLRIQGLDVCEEPLQVSCKSLRWPCGRIQILIIKI